MRTRGRRTKSIIAAVSALMALSHGAASATEGGWISGRITDVNGAPLGGACVTVSPEINDEEPFALTGADGRYRLGPLPTGMYRVELGAHSRQMIDGADQCGLLSYRPKWFPGVNEYDDATPVSVSAGNEVSQVDGVLPRYGQIQGRVTGPNGEPLGGACVTSSRRGGTETRPDGTYTLHVKFPDERIMFSDCGDPNRNLVPEVYPNQPARTDMHFDDLGQPIEVFDEGLVTGIDAQLARASTIHVYFELALEDPDPHGSLLRLAEPTSRSVWAGLSVDESRDAGNGHQPNEDEDVLTEKIFTHLAPGRYWLRAFGHVNDQWFYEWHNASETFEGATPLDVGQDETLEVTMRIVGRQGCSADERVEDMDGDGLTDCQEKRLGTGRDSADTDSDRLDDLEEVATFSTDPLDVDSDADGFGDGFEVKGGNCYTGRLSFSGGSDPADFWSTPVVDAGAIPIAPPGDVSPPVQNHYTEAICR